MRARQARDPEPPRRVALVLGTTTGGTGAHVRMLAAALNRRGIAVEVLGPSAAGRGFGFGDLDGVSFRPVEFGGRPRPGDVAAVFRLRRLLARAGAQRRAGTGAQDGPDSARGMRAGDEPRVAHAREVRADELADVAHAHGMRAGALAALALVGRRTPPLVVTVHNGPPVSGRVSRYVYRALELIVARGADLVLCVSGDLEQRMRRAGARQVGRAVVPPPARPGGAGPADLVTGRPGDPAAGRPVVLGVGRLAAQKGWDVLLRAAAAWRELEPRPLVVIAGAGPLDAELRRLAAGLGIDARFLGRREDVPALLAAASVFVLPSRWEGQPLILQEALRAAVPIVASRAGGIPGLTGRDAAILVPPGDPGPLADAVRTVLRDPARAGALRAAAAKRAATLPTEDDAARSVLESYAAVRE